ncbi:MAG: Clp1/GlmU family protein [Caldisericia bacterium]
MNISIEENWVKIKDDFIKNGKKLMVIGGSDSGKTTFILYLANEIFREGKSVGILDLDIGQSNIGPPGTIGYGKVSKYLENLSEIEPVKMYFIGSVSPKGNLLQLVVGSYKLLKEMEKESLDYILIDTTGLIDGLIGELLKHNKIELLDPDFIILFENENEIENLIKPFIFNDKKIIRVKPSPYINERTRTERINYRNERFKEYFKNYKEVEIYFKEDNILGLNLEKFIPPIDSIVGFLDKDRFLVCLGIFKKINLYKNSIIVNIPNFDIKRIKFIKFSNLLYQYYD